MAFLHESDYSVLIREEISRIIDASEEKTKLAGAEKMAIGQIRNHLAGRYDCGQIFIDYDSENDIRDQYIVMITIDIALYHLWTGEAANRIPKHRELRYNDALKWLQDVQKGMSADLPEYTDDAGDTTGSVRIFSKNPPEDNRF